MAEGATTTRALGSHARLSGMSGGVTGSRTAWLPLLSRAVAVAAVCLAGALLGISWTREAGNVAALWPPNAILLAALLHAPVAGGLRDRGCILLAGGLAIFAANLLFGDSLAVSAGLALANLSEVVLALYLVARFAEPREILRSVGQSGLILLLAGGLAPILAASIGASLLHLTYGAPLWAVWKTWYLADALSLVIFFPVACLLSGDKGWSLLTAPRSKEAIVTVAAICAASWFLFLESSLLALIALQIALMWVTFRSGRFGSALAVASMAIVVTTWTVSGVGPIGQLEGYTVADKILYLQFALIVVPIPIFAIAIALSKERETADALAESEARYRDLFEKSPVMLLSIGSDGRLLSVSEHWLDKMGYRREEVIGRPSVEFLSAGSRQQALEELLPRVFSEGAVRDVECRLVTKDGETFDALLSAIRDGAPQTRVKRSFAVITDVSKLKRAERDFADTVEKLEQSNRDLEQFAYLASHDLQEPLRMVASFTDLLEQEYGPKLDKRGREFIHYARDGAERMSRLIHDLLTFSRVTRQDDSNAVVDLNMAVNVALANLQSVIDTSGATVICDDLPSVHGSSTQLTSLFQNLVGNAIKYRGDQPPVVSLTVKRLGPHWRFTVTDNGIGIDRKHYERVFDLFKRLHHRGRYGGTGLGLAICRRIVEGHGGSIWVESEVGEGSRFHVTLPALEPVTEAAAQ